MQSAELRGTALWALEGLPLSQLRTKTTGAHSAISGRGAEIAEVAAHQRRRGPGDSPPLRANSTMPTIRPALVQLLLVGMMDAGMDAGGAEGSQVANYLTFHDSAGAPIQIRCRFPTLACQGPFLPSQKHLGIRSQLWRTAAYPCLGAAPRPGKRSSTTRRSSQLTLHRPRPCTASAR